MIYSFLMIKIFKKYITYYLLFFCVLFFSSLNLFSQEKILNNPIITSLIEKGLNYTYNYEFGNAAKIYNEIEKIIGTHPATFILRAINLYWQNYPLVTGKESAVEYVDLLNESASAADKILKTNPDDTEGILYSLIARGMIMMVYADNEESGKVFPHARAVYSAMMKSFDHQEEFRDFYFFTGLYNYYRIAYPDKHPIYKPFVFFFRDGNIAQGKKELEYACYNSIFLKPESSRFLVYIYLNYENNPETAEIYAKELYDKYKNNPYFKSKYAELLLINRKYETAKPFIKDLLSNENDRYSIMKGLIFKGLWEEKYRKNYEVAKNNYLAALKIVDEYGAVADNYSAYLYLGLSNIYDSEGNDKQASYYLKKFNKVASYEYYNDL